MVTLTVTVMWMELMHEHLREILVGAHTKILVLPARWENGVLIHDA